MRSGCRKPLVGIRASKASDSLRDLLLDDELISAISAGVHTAETDELDRDALRTRIFMRITDSPPPGTQTVRANEGSWQHVTELVQVKVLRRDTAKNNQTILIRMAPGASIVPHPHTQEEECLVLEGAIEIGAHPLYEGDMHIASPGAKHPTLTSQHGALLLVRSEIPPTGFAMAQGAA